MKLRYVLIGLAVVALIIVGSLSSKLIESLDAEQIMITQDPIDGDLHTHTTAGMKPQRLGSLEKYDKAFRAFCGPQELYPDAQNRYRTSEQEIRFNDRAPAKISYSFQCFMPHA